MCFTVYFALSNPNKYFCIIVTTFATKLQWQSARPLRSQKPMGWLLGWWNCIKYYITMVLKNQELMTSMFEARTIKASQAFESNSLKDHTNCGQLIIFTISPRSSFSQRSSSIRETNKSTNKSAVGSMFLKNTVSLPIKTTNSARYSATCLSNHLSQLLQQRIS